MFLNRGKRIATIQDISGFGKCSLTVALPIISACGIEACAIPTALLSTHMGGLGRNTYKDLTDEIMPIAKHWSMLNLHFDALYSGFLGSYKQIEIVSQVFDMLKSSDTLVAVDPCMADNGKLYKLYDEEMVEGMKLLCRKADVLTPNLTEGFMLLNEEYKSDLNIKEVKAMIRKLADFGCKYIVITGINIDDSLGVACYDRKNEKFNFFGMPKIGISYHGTGDIFASVLISGLVKGINLEESALAAVKFCYQSIKRTFEMNIDERFGVNFEEFLPKINSVLNGNDF